MILCYFDIVLGDEGIQFKLSVEEEDPGAAVF